MKKLPLTDNKAKILKEIDYTKFMGPPKRQVKIVLLIMTKK